MIIERKVCSFTLKYNLQIFANEGPGGEKTEKATPKKREKVRVEGQVAKSAEIITATMLFAFFLSIRIFATYWKNIFDESFYRTFQMFVEQVKGDEFSVATAMWILRWAIIQLLKAVAPVLIIIFVIAFVMNLVQVKWKPTSKPLKPKFSNLNPIKGFKKIISLRSLMELAKSLIKMIIIIWLTYSTLKGQEKTLLVLYDVSVEQAIVIIGEIITGLGMKISIYFLVFSYLDYRYVKYKFEKDIKMTKQEVKEEMKQMEGNPQIKSKIRRKQREISLRRMMQDLPSADVVITNPTHFAVAVKYDITQKAAPYVVAKGADFIAMKIKEQAKDFKIEIVENKPLARMIYYNVEIGEQVPPEMYQAVAEILAFVYSIKKKK